MAYVCGKCGAGGLFRDDDILAGLVYIACSICGNRWPGGAKPMDGATKQDGDMMPHRVPIENKEGSKMSITGACRNCGRLLTIIGNGCCWKCYQAGKGLEGEEKAAALASVKAKIESGVMKKGGGRRGHRKSAAAVSVVAPAGGVKKTKVEERAPEERKSGAASAGILQDGKVKVEGKAKELPAVLRVPALPVPQDIPVTIRLLVEIAVRVVPSAA
jgi:hypothetical protein